MDNYIISDTTKIGDCEVCPNSSTTITLVGFPPDNGDVFMCSKCLHTLEGDDIPSQLGKYIIEYNKLNKDRIEKNSNWKRVAMFATMKRYWELRKAIAKRTRIGQFNDNGYFE